MSDYRVTFKDSTVREAWADNAASLVWLLGGPAKALEDVDTIEIARATDGVYVSTGILANIESPPAMWLNEVDPSDCEEVDSHE